MVSWGLGHNLEKNLQKARALRERGDLSRALELLQGWAEKHEDTPHYFYEAALVAFELDDPTSGIHALKTLLRRFPDTRTKILKACADQFRDRPSLALGEFLVDHHLAGQNLDQAIEVIDALGDEDTQIFAKRVGMRHQSLQATPNTPDSKLLQVESARLVAAHAVEDAALFLEATRAVLELQPEFHSAIQDLAEKGSARSKPALLFAQGFCQRAAGDLAAASEAWAEAARQDRELLELARECLGGDEPEEKQRGRWLASRGHAELLAGEHETAEKALREACEADPSLREQVLEKLVTHEEKTEDGPTEGLCRLRLRLLVVLARHEDAARYSRALLDNQRVSAHEVRRLMGEGAEGEQDSGLRVALAEAAIMDHDLAAAATQAKEIPDSDTESLRRLLDTIDGVRDQWDPQTRQPLLTLAAVLSSRAKDEDQTNRNLTAIWTDENTEAEAALSVTLRCLESITPTRELLSRAFAALLDRGPGNGVRQLFDALFGGAEEEPTPAGPDAGGFQTIDFGGSDSLDLDLDLGDVAPDASDDLAAALITVLEAESSRAPGLLKTIDGCPADYHLGQKLRHPIAYAALLARDYERALGEFTVLQVTAGADMSSRLRTYLETAVDEDPQAAGIRIALAELDAEQGLALEAARNLAEALRTAPQRADDICQRFDPLIEKAPADEQGRLWTLYAEALFDAGRFDQLREVCGRGSECEDPAAVARLKLLAIRVMVEEGRLSEALSTLQSQIGDQRSDLPRVVEILQAILRAHPGSAAAHFLLGTAQHRSGDPVAALDSWTRSVEADAKLASRVDEKLQELQSHPSVGGEELHAIAGYHLSQERPAEAAPLLERAVRLQPSLAPRVLGELTDLPEDKEADLDLLIALATAARVDDRIDLSCELLSRVDHRDPSRIEPVLTGFRMLRESAPQDLRPVTAMARVLLRHEMRDAAARAIGECGADENFTVSDRLAVLEEFHRRCPEDARLALGFARLLGRSGRADSATEILETPVIQRGVDALAAAEVVESLRQREPGGARLALLHHDFLLRSGRDADALRALPEPESLDAASLGESIQRLDAHREIAMRHEDLASKLGRSLWVQGRHADALDCLEEAIAQLQPEATSPLRWDLVRLLAASGRGQEAQRVLDIQKAAPEEKRAAFARLGESNLERLDAEIASLEDQWRRHPGAAHLAFRLARGLLSRGQAQRAESLLEPLECDESTQAQRALLLARSRQELGRIDRAEIALQRIDWESASERHRREAFRMMAQYASQLGRHAEATARWAHLKQEFDDANIASASHLEYSRELAEIAGDHRAVLIGIGSLDEDHSPSQEQS